MARRTHDAMAVLLCAVLGCGAAAPTSGQTQEPRGADTTELPLDTRLLADLEILRDLALLQHLEVLRKVDEARGAPRPRMPREEKGKP